jgi:hypothetical protein
MSKHFRPWNIDQTLLLPPSVQDFVPKDHVSRFIVGLAREQTSEAIFGRESLTDALVIAPDTGEVPVLVSALQEAFRLEPGVFITERYGQFQRKMHDFIVTLALFTIVGGATALLAGSFAANLLHDVYVWPANRSAPQSAAAVSTAIAAVHGGGDAA